MAEKLEHWYDGWFYDFFIAPNQDKAFENLKNYIKEGSALLDAGCGTGRLCFQLYKKCSRIDGIDASEKNVAVAYKKHDKKLHPHIEFYNQDIKTFLESGDRRYDYAVLSYVIHEISENKRESILKLLSLYADKIIIVDYIYPHPHNFTGIINRLVEFFAGKIHYSNFKTYLKNGGIKGLSEKAGFKLTDEIKNNPSTSHIVILSKIDDLQF